VAWVVQQGRTGRMAHQQQAGRVLGEGEGWKFVEDKCFASDKFFFLSCRCKISEFALLEIIKITKQKTGFPS
jgi:hypothetical protein